MKTSTSLRVFKRFRSEVLEITKTPPWYILQSINISIPIREVDIKNISALYNDTLVMLHYNLGAGYKPSEHNGIELPYRKSIGWIKIGPNPKEGWKELTDKIFDSMPDYESVRVEFNPWDEFFPKSF